MADLQTGIFLQAALNGERIHPAAPRTPTAIAEAARTAVEAGAQSVHVHAFDDSGRETLDGEDCGKVPRAIRALCPETPISLTTSAAIVKDPSVEAWQEMPNLVTANQGKPGIVELCELLLSMESVSSRDAAVQHAAEMENIVVSAGITLEQVHQGYGIACWAVNRRGLDRGHGIRTGLEDVTLLPDGKPARDNADLVATAARLIRAHVQPSLL